MRSKKLFYYLIKVIWNSACKKCCAKNEPQLSQQKQKSLNINIYLLSNFNLTGRYLSYIIVHAQISRSLQRCIRCCNFSVASITFIIISFTSTKLIFCCSALIPILLKYYTMGVFTCSILASIVAILVSIVVILTSIEPILEKCVHLQV